jgi:hypothetical protein
MFSKFRSAIAALLIFSPFAIVLGVGMAPMILHAQVSNPGVTQKGAITNGNLAKWAGKNQIQDGGAIPAGTISSTALTSTGTTITVTGTSPCVGPTCSFNVDLPNKITGASVGSATAAPIITFDNQGRATAISSATITPAFASLTGSIACAQLAALTGDTTASAGSCATTTVKVNGVAYGAAPAADTVAVITAANTATYTAMPNCVSGALNYTTATHLFSCAAAGSGTVTSVTCNGVAITTSGVCSTIGQIPGIASNTAATTGNVGEAITSSVLIGSAVSLTSTATANMTQLTNLPAGDYDVYCNVITTLGAATLMSSLESAISTVSATLPTRGSNGSNVLYNSPVVPTQASANIGQQTGSAQILIASATTIYCVTNATFAGGTNAAYGFMTARRRR